MMADLIEDRLYSVRDAAELCDINVGTLRAWVLNKFLPCYTDGERQGGKFLRKVKLPELRTLLATRGRKTGYVRRPTDVYTTGQVAKLCRVAPRTVSKWFDSGQLKGYRIPGSQDRRVPLPDLVRFLEDNKMPTFGLPVEKSVLLVCQPSAAEMLKAAGYTLALADDVVQAGMEMCRRRPDHMVVDACVGRTAAADLARSIRRSEDFNECRLIVLSSEDETEPDYFTAAGYTAVLQKPFDQANLLAEIRKGRVGI